MNPIVLVPARLAASRLPGKPLADIGGEPMIVHVWRRAVEADIGPVVVAAADPQIVQAVTERGGRAVLTDPGLPSGSDRILAALGELDPDSHFDAVVNLQGDMPFIDPAALRDAIALLRGEPGCDIATLVAAASPADCADPDVCKAILAMRADGKSGRALYFTRATPFGQGPAWHHLGVYAYRRGALERFSAAPPSPLERREKLEQLRALELGLQIWAWVIAAAPISVDNPADLAAARAQAKAGRAA